MPRQLDKSRTSLPAPFVIVAHFYDVESGRTELSRRGRGTAHEKFDIAIPRDGGIADALAEARRPDRRFVAVVCESVERIARGMYLGTKIEHELEQTGVPLLAADEGIDAAAVAATRGGPRKATSVLTRRVKQAISEWYVLQMLELSWDGFKIHTYQGWNVGKPPYGYLPEWHRHPVKAKAEEGGSKHRLKPDPVRGAVVTQIFAWRALERLSYQYIANRLNNDLDQYPPPEPVKRSTHNTAIGAWTPTSVRDVLMNPKYTGFMVWNRRRNPRPERGVKGRVNPPSEWVWSPQPTHEPLVTRAMFDAASPVARIRQGSRSESNRNSHPKTARSYVLRSYLTCDLCSRRMFGKTRHKKNHDLTYYACVTNREHHQAELWYQDHPANILVNEDQILPIVSEFFAQRIFGAARRTYLTARPGDQSRQREGNPRAAVLRQEINKLHQAETNLMAQLESFQPTGDDEIDSEWRNRLQHRFADIAKTRRQKIRDLTQLENDDAKPSGVNPDLIDELPTVKFNLADVPEEQQRRLFDVFQLELRHNRLRHELTVRTTVRGDMIKQLEAAVHLAVGAPSATAEPTPTVDQVRPAAGRTVSHVLGAPHGRNP